MKAPSLTLGIEEEYQIIDPETRELKSYITEILESDRIVLRELKPELHQSVVEVGSPICQTPADARAEIVRLRRLVSDHVAESGLRIVAAGTHPFSSWMKQEITPLERYAGIMKDLGEVAHANLIFGLHVHVGIEDREFMIDAMNVARYFLPHVLALSSSSPFWEGRNTGLKSFRSIVWRRFPRTGIPQRFESWTEFEHMVDTLVQSESIPDGSKIWWDVRPNWNYPTLEFRICDMCPRIDEVVCVAAIFQAIISKLWKLRHDNMTFRVYPASLIDENKWRAARYGVRGKLVDFGKQREIAFRDLTEELIGWFLDDVLDDLGTRSEVEYAFKIIDEGSSADRQLATYERTGELNAVVDQLVAETAEGVTAEAAAN